MEKETIITQDDFTTVNICTKLLGSAKNFILDMRTAEATIKTKDILRLIEDLHDCETKLKSVSEKLRLINQYVK